MFEEVRTVVIVKCTKCKKEFQYDRQKQCPHCGSSENYIAIEDIPF